MEIIAIISHLLRYVLAVVAVILCVMLFRRQRQFGWLFVGAVFLEPLLLLVMRAFRGRPLLSYKTQALGSDGVLHVNYQWDFPVLYILTVIGLFLLVREARRGTSA
jgi:uncharacterized membrane protein